MKHVRYKQTDQQTKTCKVGCKPYDVVMIFNIILLFILVSCGKPKERPVLNQNELPVLDLSSVIGVPVQNTFSWNSVAEQITMIPIETTDVLLAYPQIVHISSDSYYLTDDKTNSILRVDRNGKVIASFSRQGQGPGEFAQMGMVHVNQEKEIIQMITFWGGGKRIEYDLTGNLIRETTLNGKGFGSVLFISDDYIVFDGNFSASHKVYVTDDELNIVQSLFPKRPALKYIAPFGKTLNRDIAFVDPDEDETVFKITDKGAEPVFIFKVGSSRPEQGQITLHIDNQGYYAIIPPFIGVVNIGSFRNYYHIIYLRGHESTTELWSKTDNRIVARNNFELTLPSGKKIEVIPSYICEDTIVFVVQAHKIFSEIEGVKEDDNPVIIHIKLKK